MTFIATVLLQMLQNEIRQSPFSLDYKLLRIKPRKEHTVPADCIS